MQLTKRYYPQVRENVYNTVLPSGLTVLTVPRAGFSRYYAVLMTRYGSNDVRFRLPGEQAPQEVPDGIAHFLEHQLFAKSWGSADERFSAWGASCNAFTTWTRTGYLFSTTDHFLDCLGHLVDFVYDPYFTEEGTAKEKGIIEQEISMYEDDPTWRVYLNLLQGLFHEHPVRRDIAGTAESVKQVSKQLLDHCYQAFYHPGNMVLVVVGDLDPEETCQRVADQMAPKSFMPQGEIARLFPDEPATILRPETTMRSSITTPLFALGFKDRQTGLGGQDLFKRQVLTELVLHAAIGKGSPLYHQLYASGLIDSDFEASYAGHPDHGFTVMQGESKQPEQLRTEICSALSQLLTVGLDEESFLLSRKALYGDFLQSLNGLEDMANELADGYFDGVDFFTYADVLQQLTLAEANQRLREHLHPDWSAFSQVLPLEE